MSSHTNVHRVTPEPTLSDVETGEQLLARIQEHRQTIQRARATSRRPPIAPEGSEGRTLPPLPDGWLWARLDAVADIKGGITKDKKRNPEGCELLPYLRVANVQRGFLDLTEIKEILVPKDTVASLLLEPGDVLFNEGGDRDKLGRGWVWNGQVPQCVFQNHVFRARLYVPGSMEPKFISWYANTFGQAYFTAKGKQTTNLASINKTMLSAFPVPVAPLDQQKRIVAEIEKQFSRLDEAVVNLKRVKANLKRYKAAVLKAAVEGRLVETEAELAHREGRSFETGEQRLQRILKDRRQKWEETELAIMKGKGKTPIDGKWRNKYKEPGGLDTNDLPELPEGWAWTTLGALLLDIEAGKSFKCEERPPDEDEFGVVKVSAVTWGEFNESESKTCLDERMVNERLVVRSDDFLFSRANTIELVGACVIAKEVTTKVMLSDKILRFRLLGGLDKWVLYSLRSKLGREEIERLATGNQESMRNIGQERIRAIRIPLPPVDECRRVCAEVESRLSVVSQTEVQVDVNLERGESLRRSALTAAFSGRISEVTQVRLFSSHPGSSA